VVASVPLDGSDEHLDLKEFLEVFFANHDNLQGLQQRLESEDVFAQEIFWKTNVSTENSSQNHSIRGSVVGTFFGVAISLLGFGAIWVWSRRRRQRFCTDGKQPDQLNQFSYTNSYDTDDCLYPTGVNVFPSTKRVTVDSKSFETREIPALCRETREDRQKLDESHRKDDDEFSNDDKEQNDIEESMISRLEPPHLTYTPALMTTESNIEVPETPQTAFFGTPAGGGTKSIHSFGGTSILDIPKLPPRAKNKTCSTSISHDTKRKILLPQLWKTPFRRDAQIDMDDEEVDGDDDDSDVVAFTPPRRRRSNDIRAERYAPHPPVEIGGPENIPSLVPSKAAEEDSVDIVDEVAYLYSTTEDSVCGKNETSN
jgi:hypothetical protein